MTGNSGLIRLAVLVPHRDIRAAFSHDRHGFPAAAPLALTVRPLSPHELKIAAAALRAYSADAGRAGKIALGSETSLSITPRCTLYGRELLAPAPPLPKDAVLRAFSPIVLGIAIGSGKNADESRVPPPSLQAAPAVSACALANMVLRPLGEGDAFEWKIGKPVWLPRYKKIRYNN